MWILLVILWTGPAGYAVTAETGLTLDSCKEKAFMARGEARCIKP